MSEPTKEEIAAALRELDKNTCSPEMVYHIPTGKMIDLKDRSYRKYLLKESK